MDNRISVFIGRPDEDYYDRVGDGFSLLLTETQLNSIIEICKQNKLVMLIDYSVIIDNKKE